MTQTNKPRLEVPGSDNPPAGFPGATPQPPTEANADKVVATEKAAPGALTLEEMQAEFFKMKQQLDAQAAVIEQQQAGMNKVVPQLEPISIDAARQQAQKHIDNGEVPPAVLTEGGWFVHALTHSSTESVEKQQERDEKASKKHAEKHARRDAS